MFVRLNVETHTWNIPRFELAKQNIAFNLQNMTYFLRETKRSVGNNVGQDFILLNGE